MVYQWRIPSIYNIPAQDAGEEIESCKNEEGYITPTAVVQRAKATSSAIHDCFEWNDRAAAEHYRVHQAGELIRNVVTVTVTEHVTTKTPVRAFVNIKGESERGYKKISMVVNNCGEYGYLLDCAKRELDAFSRKYESLVELGAVMAAIREVLV